MMHVIKSRSWVALVIKSPNPKLHYHILWEPICTPDLAVFHQQGSLNLSLKKQPLFLVLNNNNNISSTYIQLKFN